MTAAKAAGTSATHLGLRPPALPGSHPYQGSASGPVSPGLPLRPGHRCAAGDRCEPLASDGVWTKRGPPIGCRTTQRSASVQRCNGLIRSAEGRAAGPEQPTTAPTGPIGARVFHGLHETAARYKSVWIVPAERFPIRDPPVDHRQVIWGCAAWAQPSRQAGDLSFRGWTAEPPAQRRHGVSLAGPLEVEEVGFDPAPSCSTFRGRRRECAVTWDSCIPAVTARAR